MRGLYREPVAWVFTAYLAGIVLAGMLPMAEGKLLLCIAGGFLTACIPRFRSFFPVFIVAIFFLLGAVGYNLSMKRLPPDSLVLQTSPAVPVEVTGVIRSFPEVSAERTRFILDAEQCAGRRARGRVRVTLLDAPKGDSGKDSRRDLRYGDRVRLQGRFLPPRNFGNPGAFDYAGYLARKGIRLTVTTAMKNLVVLGTNRGNSLVRFVFEEKRSFHDFIRKRLDSEAGRLLPALVVGDRSGLEEDLRRRFANGGAAHLLAISGLHIGFSTLFFYTVLLGLFRFLLPERLLRESRFWWMPSRLAAVGSLFFLLYYVILVGGRTASIRAAIMIGVFLLSRILERSRDLLHTLLVAAFVILLWSPPSCFAVDFQLSFAAVTAMVLYERSREENDPSAGEGSPDGGSFPLPARENRAPAKWTAKGIRLLTITVLAFAATLPITVILFHRIPLGGLLSNLLLVPLTGLVIVPCGMVTFALFLLSPFLAVYPAKLTALGITFLLQGVDFFGTGLLRPVWVVPPPALWVILFYVILVVLLTFPRMRHSFRVVSVFVLSAFFVLATLGPGKGGGDGRLHIDILDVGNAASTLLVLPDGKTVLIDGGGAYASSWDVGRNVILPALLTLGIRRIDLMILTHPHPDHLNGLVGLLEEFPVGEVWDGWRTFPSEWYRRFRQIIEAKGIPRRYIGDGRTTFPWGRVVLEVFRCKTPLGKNRHSQVNNGSMIVKVTLGRFSFLNTADLEAEGEKAILDRYGPALKATVLEVGHHGSRTSTTEIFLDTVRPEAAVISVGACNPFGHPAAEVLGRLRYIAPRKSLLRTDRDGMIHIETDGTTCRVTIFREGFSLDSPGVL